MKKLQPRRKARLIYLGDLLKNCVTDRDLRTMIDLLRLEEKYTEEDKDARSPQEYFDDDGNLMNWPY